MTRNYDLTNKLIGSSLFETIERHGSAGAEFIKGLRGIDHQTGMKFDRSLLDVSKYKINPDFKNKNIKQQAGFSAEIARVAKANSKAIIEGKSDRFIRSEDFSGYGKNHQSVDIIQLSEGKVFTSQMKFVSDAEGLLQKIAKGEGGGKNDYSRYLNVDKLEVPTEQVAEMKRICETAAKELKAQSLINRQRGNIEVADKLQKQSENYTKLQSKISDSGITTDEAISYRLNPRWETTKDIANVGHKAGLQGAKFGFAIGGSINVITNFFAYNSGDKEFSDALLDTAKGTLTSAGVGYATAFTGSAIKSGMQQSSNLAIRQLSKTGLPGMVVSTCLSTAKTINKYANDEIDETELMQEIGSIAASTISTSMFTVIGQLAIPIPIVGGLIGGMVGYLISNNFYYSFIDALRSKQISYEKRKNMEMQAAATIAIAQQYSQAIQSFFDAKIAQFDFDSREFFRALDSDDIDDMFARMNNFGSLLGKEFSIKNQDQLDAIMASDKPLIL